MTTSPQLDPHAQARTMWTQSAAPWCRWRHEMAEQSAEATALLVRASGARTGHQVLDLASGTGEPALSLAAAVSPTGHVVATDLVSEMAATIMEDARARGLTTLSVQTADMEDLPFADGRFDLVTSRFGIMFPPDVQRALGQVRRVLVPGGRVALLVWGAPDQPFFAASLGVFRRYSQQPPPPPDAPTPFRFSTPGSLSTALRAAGFGDVEEATHTIRWIWPGTVDEAWTAMSEVQAAIFRGYREALDDATFAHAMDEAKAVLRGYDDGTRLDMPAEVIVATATA